MSEQARQPQGVPVGGQFAPMAKPESGIELRPLDGSFLYPPIFTSATDVVDFWSRVEIPDEVLARAERVYRETREPLGREWAAGSWESWTQHDWDADNPQPDPADVGATADWEGRKRAAQADWEMRMRQVLADRPESLDRRDVRPLVRAAAMFRSAAGDLDWDGYKDVCGHEIVLTSGRTSVQDASIDTGLGAVASRFLDADRYELDRAMTPAAEPVQTVTKDDIRAIVEQTVSKAISEQNVALDRALDELTDNIGRVGQVAIDMNDPRFGKRRR